MPEFKVYTRINVPYSKVWEKVSVVREIERWCPVKFTIASEDEVIQNGLRVKQKKKLFGLFGCEHLEVVDAYTNSKVRRQYSLADEKDKYKFNRVTYMFDDNSITTMLDLCEDEEAKSVLEDQAKSEPTYQIDVMCHVYYTFGSTFWRSVTEVLFIKPFFKLIYKGRAEKTLKTLKKICETE